MSDGSLHDSDAACPGCRLVTLDDGETLVLWCATCVGIHQQNDEELYHTLLHAQPGQPGNLGLLSLISPSGDSEVENDGEKPSNRTHEREYALLDDIWEHVDKYLQMGQVENIYERREESTTNMQLGHNIFGTSDHHAAELSGFGYHKPSSNQWLLSDTILTAFIIPAPTHHMFLARALSQPQHRLFGIPPSPDMQNSSLWSHNGLNLELPFALIPLQSFQEFNAFSANTASNDNLDPNPAGERGNSANGRNDAKAQEDEDEGNIASQPSISGTDGSSVPHRMGRKGQESGRRHAQGFCIWWRRTWRACRWTRRGECMNGATHETRQSLLCPSTRRRAAFQTFPEPYPSHLLLYHPQFQTATLFLPHHQREGSSVQPACRPHIGPSLSTHSMVHLWFTCSTGSRQHRKAVTRWRDLARQL